jgi:hypothetical protein
MPNREQRQDQRQKGPRNPTQVVPDDDEVEETGDSPLGAQDEGEASQPQPGRRRRAQDPSRDQEQVTQVEDEEAEDDEDEDDGKEDGSGARV